MLFKARSFVSFPCKIALLFFAFAVFSWGLQAKLELYKPPVKQKILIAKLSTEKRSAKVLQALERRDTTPEHSHKLVVALYLNDIWTDPTPWPAAEEAEIALSHPGRSDLRSIHSLQLPPPSLF